MPSRLKYKWTCTLEGWSLVFMNLVLLTGIASAAHTVVYHTPFDSDSSQLSGTPTCGRAWSEVCDGSSQRNTSPSIWVYGLKGKTRAIPHWYDSCTSSLFWCLKAALGYLQHSSDLPKSWRNTFCHLHVSHQKIEGKQVRALSIQSYGKYRLIAWASYSFWSRANHLEDVLYTSLLWCPTLKGKGALKICGYSWSKGTTNSDGPQ